MLNVEWMRFGRLVITNKTDITKYGNQKVDCVCDCWNKKNIILRSLVKGLTKSCWCLRKESMKTHWHASNINWMSKTYITRCSMKNRCKYAYRENYKYYWWKGIKICKRRMKFENFLEDMWERPLWKTIDRIDSNKWYYKKNCKRSTPKEQNINRKSSHNIKYRNKIYTMTDLAIKLWVKRTTLAQRIKNWGIKKAVEYK